MNTHQTFPLASHSVALIKPGRDGVTLPDQPTGEDADADGREATVRMLDLHQDFRIVNGVTTPVELPL